MRGGIPVKKRIRWSALALAIFPLVDHALEKNQIGRLKRGEERWGAAGRVGKSEKPGGGEGEGKREP